MGKSKTPKRRRQSPKRKAEKTRGSGAGGARQVAKTIDKLFADLVSRRALRRWRQHFQRCVEAYIRRLDKAERSVQKAREAIRNEDRAVQEKAAKRRLTCREQAPRRGLVWCQHVVEVPASKEPSRPVKAGASMTRVRGIGGWVSKLVKKRLTEGPEPPPWYGEDPPLATQAMVLALFRDRYLKQAPKLLPEREDDATAMPLFREDYRFDDWESCAGLRELWEPSEDFGAERVDIIETYLNRVESHLARIRSRRDERLARASAGKTAGEARKARGATLRQAAGILYGDLDPESVPLALASWRKKRVPKPPSIGKCKGDHRAKLYDCAALADYVMKVGEHITVPQSTLCERLEYLAEEPAD